jgi:hypothetical protein
MSFSDLTSLGLDALVLVGIIGISQGVKFALGLHKNKAKWFIVVPMVLGAFAAVLRADPWTMANIVKQTLGYAGAAAMLYIAGMKIAGKK